MTVSTVSSVIISPYKTRIYMADFVQIVYVINLHWLVGRLFDDTHKKTPQFISNLYLFSVFYMMCLLRYKIVTGSSHTAQYFCVVSRRGQVLDTEQQQQPICFMWQTRIVIFYVMTASKFQSRMDTGSEQNAGIVELADLPY